MSFQNRLIRPTFLFIFWIGMALNSLGQKPQVRIGLIFDGPSERNSSLAAIYRYEIKVVLEDEYAVTFPEDKTVVGDWTLERVNALTDELLSDPAVDVVISVGILASQHASQRTSLSKPVFAALVIEPELQGLPSEIVEVDTGRPGEKERYNVTGIHNLNYLVFGGDPAEDIQRFSEIVPFSKLTILVMEAMDQAVEGLESSVKEDLSGLQLERIDWIPVSRSVSSLDMQPDTEAVLVTPLMHLDSNQFSALVDELNSRALPTMSSWGKDELERGLFATLHTGDDPVRRSRRIAMNIQEALEGRDPGEMPTNYELDTRLILNMATARKIGLSPKYTVLLEAELLNQEADRPSRTLSLASVVRESTNLNLDLAAADRTVAAGEQSVREARAPLLPQVGLSGGFNVVDSDRARVFPTLAETQTSASLSASQVIYSDKAWANYSIEQNFQMLRLQERAQLRLDVILEAADAYLGLLRAQTVAQIQRDNLELTRSNLALASSRVEIGVAGREELFRWESQVATNQRDLVAAESVGNQAIIAVNRILNRPLNEKFATVEATLNAPEFVASFESLGPYIDNPRGFSLFSDFMTGEALSAAPELRQFDAFLKAKNREMDAARRSFFLPDVGLVSGMTLFNNHGIGSELPPGLNNTDWFVGINASLPLFEGTERYAKIHRIKLQIDELSLQREAASQRVEQRIRSLLEAANSSFIGIELSKTQAESARQNLKLVTDSYGAGVVGILALLDAQNQALVAELVAANAVFQYLTDLMSVQRAVGRFDFFRTPQERQEYLSRLTHYYEERGIQVVRQ